MKRYSFNYCRSLANIIISCDLSSHQNQIPCLFFPLPLAASVSYVRVALPVITVELV